MSYPKFTPEMKKTHRILVPSMAPIQFQLVLAAMEEQGYMVELLGNCGSQVSELGLKYVHNDTCYPALLVIGQFIDALQTGAYDLDHTALLLTQTGGGCRASNYIHLLRKALENAGFGQVPVASLNFSGLEKDSGISGNIDFWRKFLAAVYYGDLLATLRAQTKPYELQAGDADRLLNQWTETLQHQLRHNVGFKAREVKRVMPKIAHDFALIPKKVTPKVKVGVVGEIYVKYSPLGNNDLEKFLESQDCEVNLPGLMGFGQYAVYNIGKTAELYGGSLLTQYGAKVVLWYLESTEKVLIQSLKDNGYHAPLPFSKLQECCEGIISRGNKMGEGWLLTAEMVELVQHGYENIVCAQPFGCLPNHICGKGMINSIRALYPHANITPIDYDPSATRVNQENRIKLMLAVAKERLEQQVHSEEALPVH
ncbi:2-hydroxyacyl-CoA dehydratase [Bengtsoniella intestinalis]|uniref:2-hydroxyglutaryl-CoA dehydratase n=1 Tax=Bengtsoniella intestinalis TaxID=3073143 RepID=UPI00391F759E